MGDSSRTFVFGFEESCRLSAPDPCPSSGRRRSVLSRLWSAIIRISERRSGAASTRSMQSTATCSTRTNPFSMRPECDERDERGRRCAQNGQREGVRAILPVEAVRDYSADLPPDVGRQAGAAEHSQVQLCVLRTCGRLVCVRPSVRNGAETEDLTIPSRPLPRRRPKKALAEAKASVKQLPDSVKN